MGLFDALPRGVQAELHTRTLVSSSVRFMDNEYEGSLESTNTAMMLRLIKDGKMSVVASSKPGSEEEMLRDALGIVGYGNAVRYDFPGPSPVEDIELYSEDASRMDIRGMAEIGEDLLAAVREYDRRIRTGAAVELQKVEVSLQNSNGFAGRYKKTGYYAQLYGRLVQGDDFLSCWDGRDSWTTDIDHAALKKTLIEQFDWAKTVVGFDAGAYPVIFAPSQVAFLMNPFVSSLNGKAIASKISPLQERMGEAILDPRFTLVDDGTTPHKVSSAPFDREGVPTRRNALIDRGVVNGMLLDLQTAKELGKQSTGNGSGPGPAPHHLALQPGDVSLDDMIRGIDMGILLLGSMGSWSGNPYGGNVSGTISLGMKIEKGRIAGRVKNCMFSLNSFRHFRDSLRALSRETKGEAEFGGGATYPYVALDDVVITTK